MKRILYISDAQSIHTRRWAEYFRNQGVDVHIASFRPAKIENVTIHLLPTYGIGKLGYLFSILLVRKIAARIKPDIVHAQYVTSYGFIAAAARLRPLVVTAWGTDVLISPQKSRLSRIFARYAVLNSDRITTVAEHMNRAVVELGVNEADVLAVPFGVDAQLFHLPAAIKKIKAPVRIISTRKFDTIYDVGTLISAVSLVSHDGYDIRLDLIGDGPLKEDLEALTQQHRLQQITTFHGRVSLSNLVALLGKSHIFVSTSLSDGNNISLNEAMACGCYPIATDIPANSQWIVNRQNGLLYSGGDAKSLAKKIIEAIRKAEWESVATINRNIVEAQASWNVCVERMSGLYNSIIN